MPYKIEEAKRLIIKAGLELVNKKLIARTWGNISARISDSEFVITPSGIPYDKVNNENLVVVKIEDCSSTGNVKPSGEKKVHAAIYQLRKDVDFIVHTHQNYATAVSVDGIDKDFAPVAKYGLPSTKGLVNNVKQSVIAHPDKKAFLMARHGALLLGKNYDEAFALSIRLEEDAKALYEKVKTDKGDHFESKPYLDDYAQMFGYSKKAVEEDKEAVELVKYKNTLAAKYQKKLKPMKCLDVLLQHFIYKKKYSKLKDKQ